MAGGASGGSSPFNFGKSTATLLNKENNSTITFDDVAGLDKAELEVREIVAVYRTLNYYISDGEFEDLSAMLPAALREFILGGIGHNRMCLFLKMMAGQQ